MDADNLMPKLLATLIRQKKETSLRLSTHHAPELLVDDHVVTFETQRLSLQDTLDLVRSVTPHRNQRELADDGRTRFVFELSHDQWIEISLWGIPGDFVVKARQVPNTLVEEE